MIILGIESSCDETAAAIVTSRKEILANEIFSQLNEHSPFGGVVPEVGARAHLEQIDAVVKRALSSAHISLSDLDGIAVTTGPGLIGGVIVGTMFAKALAMTTKRPFLAINHLEAHALTARLTSSIEFPFLLLLLSGGHCQFLIVHNVNHYTKIGSTIDDAAGECLDKTGRILGLDYPAGPQIEKLARKGNPKKFILPKPLFNHHGCNFSFSGLKTAARQLISTFSTDDLQTKADFCASLQLTIAEILVNRTAHAIDIAQNISPLLKTLVLAGGVAANQYFRSHLNELTLKKDFEFITPPVALCTDNAAMVAWAGVERLRLNLVNTIDFEPRPRWPLEELKGDL